MTPLVYAAFARLMRDLPAAWQSVRRAFGYASPIAPAGDAATVAGPAEVAAAPLRIEPADRPARRAA